MIKKKYCVIVNAVVVKDDKILICKRSAEEKHVPGKWSPPGGKLEEQGRLWNALEKTARREVLEEAGVEVKDKMDFLVNNTFCHAEDNLPVAAIVFVCYYKSGRAKPLEDTVDVRWISEDELDNFEFTHQNVKDYVAKAFEFLKKNKKTIKTTKS